MSNHKKMTKILALRSQEALAGQEVSEPEQGSASQLLDVVSQEITPCEDSVAKSQRRTKGIGRKLVQAAGDKLVQGEQLGLFTSLSISDKNSIPTLLARLPIFIPVPASKQTKLLDRDLAYRFETPFGRGRRFGPPVTIEDEDVLFALMQLSERRLIGQGGRLPIPLENDQWLKDKDGHLTVQITIATIGQINSEIGLSRAGKNYKATLASLKRLSHVGIELETRRKDLYLGESWDGENIRLIDIKWRAYEDEGLIFAQFSPVIVKWLKEQATFFNWSVRRQIKSPNGKALHRFLSTQGKHYRAELDYIANAIEWDGNRDRLRPRMEAVLKQLRDELDWCNFEISGTGRSTPFVLEFWRLRT
jgi:hypothetical protein